MAIDKDMLDQLLAGRDPQDLFAKDGLLDELKKALSERMLSAELVDHLESEGAEGTINRRTGSSRTTMLTGTTPARHPPRAVLYAVSIDAAPVPGRSVAQTPEALVTQDRYSAAAAQGSEVSLCGFSPTNPGSRIGRTSQ